MDLRVVRPQMMDRRAGIGAFIERRFRGQAIADEAVFSILLKQAGVIIDASPLTGTDPLLLIASDPASAHRFVVSRPNDLILGLP